MAVDEENVSRVLTALSHRLRREILLTLAEKGERSFTEIMNTLNVDTGKLSFHIRNLAPFLEQTAAGKYKLSRAGESAVRVIRDVESWAEVADIHRKSTQLNLATYRKRVYAFLVDFAITLLIGTLLAFPSAIGLFNLEGLWGIPLGILWIAFVALAVLWVYSTLLEGFNGQSIGKRIFRLKVLRMDGKKLSYEHAAVRNFGKVLLPLDLVFGYTLKDERYKRYFDKFAGTTVIDIQRGIVIPPTQETTTQANAT